MGLTPIFRMYHKSTNSLSFWIIKRFLVYGYFVVRVVMLHTKIASHGDLHNSFSYWALYNALTIYSMRELKAKKSPVELGLNGLCYLV